MPIVVRRPACSLVIAATLAWPAAATHPRLLISAEDVPAIRARCGLRPSPQHADVFASRSTEYHTLRAWFAARPDGPPQPGEIAAAAFLHVVAPGADGDGVRLKLIESALVERPLLLDDDFELVLALDWCWDALNPTTRDEFLLRLRRETTALTPADSPLEHRTFRAKLASLAACVVAGTTDAVNAAWLTPREEYVRAANAYWRETFPQFVRFRGRVPTVPEAAAEEESDAALFLDVLRAGGAGGAWDSMRDSVGRWMEHHALAEDLLTLDRWDELTPVTAHLIAARTHDPAAAWVADRVEERMKSAVADPLALLWRWVPIVFDLDGIARYDNAQPPSARNLNGQVVFRGETNGLPVRVTLDAGQPFLRRGQAFDAGSFAVFGRTHLVGSAGQPIEVEATPSKGGKQRIGSAPGEFDFAQFNTSTIAHNAMLFWDEVRLVRWYDAMYAPVGGQVPREGTCREFTIEPDAQQRSGGTLTAYGSNGEYGYAAVDLGAAYDPRSVATCTREVVFLGDRFLVIDRARTTSPRVEPVFVVQAPARPRVSGADLPDERRIDGLTNDRGAWRFTDRPPITWTLDRDDLHVVPVWPPDVRVTVVGGPAARERIEAGRWQGLRYVGGDRSSFERRVQPVGRRDFENAWYRLGEPVLLDVAALTRPVWGRIEIEPRAPGETCMCVVLVVVSATGASPPSPIEATEDGNELVLRDVMPGVSLRLPQTGIGGVLSHPPGREWRLPSSVAADDPLPTKP